MKRALFLLIILYGIGNVLSSQTTDLTILLLHRNSLNEDLCQKFSNSENLLKLMQKGDTCIFKCKVDNLCNESDSIILTIGKWSSITGDYIEFCQYFSNIDSANIEYNEYIKCLIQEFNVDSNFYKYKIINIPVLDSAHKTDVFKIESLYINSLLFISLENIQDSYVIKTRIL